jgi:hypothetical protein
VEPIDEQRERRFPPTVPDTVALVLTELRFSTALGTAQRIQRREPKMTFTGHELIETANELRREISRFLSNRTKPDVLLGNHPVCVFASQKQGIASWHGTRIENHLADWICKVPYWTAKARERISIGGRVHEIDNLAWNSQLDLVVAVEAKRVWANQDKASKEDVRRKNRLYMDPANSPIITSRVSQFHAAFRHFVFDAYGKTRKGKDGLPVIAGDEIEHVFDRTFASYIEWERQVMANAFFKELDPDSQNFEREESLAKLILEGSSASDVKEPELRPVATVKLRQSILDFIDKHAA